MWLFNQKPFMEPSEWIAATLCLIALVTIIFALKALIYG